MPVSFILNSTLSQTITFLLEGSKSAIFAVFAIWQGVPVTLSTGIRVGPRAFSKVTIKKIGMSNSTFVGPCLVIYFYSKTNQMHNISNLFYFGTTLYLVHVLDGLSVHHQESKTVHTASDVS